jgi:hypothetical protein
MKLGYFIDNGDMGKNAKLSLYFTKLYDMKTNTGVDV